MDATVPPRPQEVKSIATRRRALKENLVGFAFILPASLIIIIFGLFPIGYAIYMSLFNWRITKGDFIGLGNYQKIVGNWGGLALCLLGIALLVAAYWVWNKLAQSVSIKEGIAKFIAVVILIGTGVAFSFGWQQMLASGSKEFLNSLIITVFYAIFSVPTQLLLAMALAYMLFQKIRGKELFRMIYFLPYITPVVSTAVVFRIIFNPRETSLANIVLGWFNAEPLKWLFESKSVLNMLLGTKLEGLFAGPSLALLTIVLFGVWTFVGYNTVIFLAGLGSISKEIYEAAEIDGANATDLFTHITMPLLSPVTFYLFLVSFIGTFKAFNHIYVMMVPAAQKTVLTTSVQIFQVMFVQQNYGQAASQAIILFLIIVGLTIAQNKLLGDKVFYG